MPSDNGGGSGDGGSREDGRGWNGREDGGGLEQPTGPPRVSSAAVGGRAASGADAAGGNSQWD